MNILITGGLGYVGTSLIPFLLRNNSVTKAVIYDNLSNNSYDLFLNDFESSTKIKFIEGSILDNHSLKKVINDNNIEAVVHAAAKTLTPMSDNGFHEFDQINHWGTSVLIDAVNSTNTVKKFVFLSSFSVYGTYKNVFWEDNEAMPQSNYGKSKYLAEKEVLNRLADHLNKIILRPGVVFGTTSGFSPTTVLNKFLFTAHFFNNIQVFGNGSQKRPFIHVKRLCDIITRSLFVKLEKSIYNVYDYNLSIDELSNVFSKIYTGLDVIYMNRDHQMKSIELNSRFNLNEILKIKPPEKIENCLQECIQRFSF